MDYTLSIGIHQPNFLPWFGYFYKIAQCDCFVFLDDVIYSKKSFTRRVNIHHPNQINRNIYSRISLQKHSDHTLISELRIYKPQNWIRECQVQWKNSYHHAPYYQQIVPKIIVMLEKTRLYSGLSEINITLILESLQLLKLSINTKKSSELNIDDTQEHINIKICRELKATHYLSGQGAKKYQRKEDFTKNNITLDYIQIQAVFQHFNIPEHLHNKSIISWMMYYSLEEINTFLQYKPE